MLTIAVVRPIEIALSRFSTHLTIQTRSTNDFLNNLQLSKTDLIPRRKFDVPSVPPMNLLIQRNTKNIINFGMQSIGQAPGEAVPPVELSFKLSFTGMMQRQFRKTLDPFSKFASSLHPA